MGAKIDTIIFDLGGVLVDWKPEYLYRKIFGDEQKVQWFLKTICTSKWNAEQDAGRTIAEANSIKIAEFPEYQKEIRQFYERWEEMLNGPIVGTVDIFRTLKNLIIFAALQENRDPNYNKIYGSESKKNPWFQKSLLKQT